MKNKDEITVSAMTYQKEHATAGVSCPAPIYHCDQDKKEKKEQQSFSRLTRVTTIKVSLKTTNNKDCTCTMYRAKLYQIYDRAEVRKAGNRTRL